MRFLLLGGDERAAVHEQGPQMSGAWVSKTLNLEDSTTVSGINCRACTFSEPLLLRRSNLPGTVFLQESHVPGIHGDGAAVKGDVFLRDGFKAIGTVRLPGAYISGDLDLQRRTD